MEQRRGGGRGELGAEVTPQPAGEHEVGGERRRGDHVGHHRPLGERREDEVRPERGRPDNQGRRGEEPAGPPRPERSQRQARAASSPMISRVIRKPETTKNTSTPMKPPRTPSSSAWYAITAVTASARRPSMSGRKPRSGPRFSDRRISSDRDGRRGRWATLAAGRRVAHRTAGCVAGRVRTPGRCGGRRARTSPGGRPRGDGCAASMRRRNVLRRASPPRDPRSDAFAWSGRSPRWTRASAVLAEVRHGE